MTNNDKNALVSLGLNKEYKTFLNDLKDKIRSARFRTALSINQDVLQLYWHIGNQVIEKQEKSSWGSKFLESLSKDLQISFPETHGFSVRNLKYMRQFAQIYPNIEFGQQAVAQLPWGHIILLIGKIKDEQIREWYANQTIELGWSRDSLSVYIRDNLYQRQAISSVKASNYKTHLPSPQSHLAQELLKQPYNFDFLGLHDEAHEREIEYAATKHITNFLLELGKGFAFVGRQVPITLNENTYFIDMLFYNLKLHAYIVCEFKATKFKPEHAGQLNFYLNLIDDYYKLPEDNQSIGLLLCKTRDKFEAEYALKGINKPIGVSEYQLTRAIPDNLKSNLPTIEEIESELNHIELDDENKSEKE